MNKKFKIQRPNRDPDHYSKRNVAYWFNPEWTRGTSSDGIYDMPSNHATLTTADGRFICPCASYGKIHAVKVNGDVELHMKSKDGNLTYIQGSIQTEFKRWHEDRSIDFILLGLDVDEIIE